MNFFDFPVGLNWTGVFNFKIISYCYIGGLSNLKVTLQNSRSERGRDDYCTTQRQRHDIPVACILCIPTIYIYKNHNFLESSSMHDAILMKARPICRCLIEWYLYFIIISTRAQG